MTTTGALIGATNTQTASGFNLALDGLNFVYAAGATVMADPTSPAGYSWHGTQTDGKALVVHPVVKLCGSSRQYALIKDNAILVTSLSEILGKKFYTVGCGAPTTRAASESISFNADGSAEYHAAGSVGTTHSSAAFIAQGFSAGGAVTVSGSVTSYDYGRIYKANIAGTIRYFLVTTGRDVNAAGTVIDSWADPSVEEALIAP